MIAGETLALVAHGGEIIHRAFVAEENGVFFVCKPAEFEAARTEGREPVCIGFRREYVLNAEDGRLTG